MSDDLLEGATVIQSPMLVCQWPQGPHADTIIYLGTGDIYCTLHDDDMLPLLHTGQMSACVGCGKTSVTWTRDQWTGTNAVCLHDGCRREWLLRQIQRPAKGAYARRNIDPRRADG